MKNRTQEKHPVVGPWGSKVNRRLRLSKIPSGFLAAMLAAGCLTTLPLAATAPSGHVTYALGTLNNNTQEGKEAYARIKIAMDSAMYYYNTYTTLTKKITAQYKPSVPTAEANFDGLISFGKEVGYQVLRVALHETSHTIGVGTVSQWEKLMVNGVFTGQKATAKLREITADPNAVISGDKPPSRLQHFWPYGLNKPEDVKSSKDFVNHCLMVNEIYKDLFPTATAARPAVLQADAVPVISVDESVVRFTGGLPSQGRIEAALFSLSGRKVAAFGSVSGGGTSTVSLDNSSIPAGQYVYRLITGNVRYEGAVMLGGK